MADVRITVKRITVHRDLMEQYENPIEHACDMKEGMVFVSHDGRIPEGMCDSAWEVMRPFAESLARGVGNFFDGWMKDPMSAMISCNDGFRPVSFYLEVIRGPSDRTERCGSDGDRYSNRGLRNSSLRSSISAIPLRMHSVSNPMPSSMA